MFSHLMIGARDIPEAKAFYDAALGTLGAAPGIIDPRGRAIYRHHGGTLMVTIPIDGEPATHANGGTIGFAAAGPAEVDAFYAAALACGGAPCAHAPETRDTPSGTLYVGYLRDPTGNKLCIVHRTAPAT